MKERTNFTVGREIDTRKTFHVGGINFPMKYVPGTNFSLKKFRQNKFSVKYVPAEQISLRNKYFVALSK